VTLSDSEIFNDTKHRAVPLRQLNFLFSQCYNTKILSEQLSIYYFTYLLCNLWFTKE